MGQVSVNPITRTLDLAGIDLGILTEEIVEFVLEGREKL